MSYQALARKWRPRQFADLVGQEHVVRALVNALDNDRLHHAFLFTGTRGVGKTTLARILAKSLNCEQGVSSTPCGTCPTCVAVDEGRFVDLIEVDAASRTKVDDTRELLDNVQYAPTRGRYKVYLVDEVHMLSGHSFNALLKTLEEPPPHVKFLFATTDPQKLPVTVLSRCLQFNLKPLTADQIAGQLNRILDAEKVAHDAGSVTLLSRAADGSMRDALSLLDQAIAYGAGEVSEAEVRGMLGTIEDTHIRNLLEALAGGDADALLGAVTGLAERTPDYGGALDELLRAFYHLSLAQTAPMVLKAMDGVNPAVEALANQISPEDVQLFYQVGLLGKRDLPLAPDPRSGFEMALLRMLAFRPLDPGQADGGGTRQPTASRPAGAPNPASAASAVPEAAERPAPPKAPPAAPRPDAPAPGVSETPTPKSPPTAAPVAGLDLENWSAYVQGLDVTGLLRELVSHTVPQSYSDGKLVLVLDEKSARLLNKDREQAVGEAVVKACGMPLAVEIRVGSPGGETPAQTRRRVEDERQRAAEAAIHDDPNVQIMVEKFGARINPDSIRPKD